MTDKLKLKACEGLDKEELEFIIQQGGMRKLISNFMDAGEKRNQLIKDVRSFIVQDRPIDLLEAIERAS